MREGILIQGFLLCLIYHVFISADHIRHYNSRVNQQNIPRFISVPETISSPLSQAPGNNSLTQNNLTGVDMASIARLQNQMKDRIQHLGSVDEEISADLKNVEQQSTSMNSKGLKLRNEIIDPASVEKLLEEFEREASLQNKKEKLTAALVDILVGEMSPPIIILEAPDTDPLENHLLMKLITCKETESSSV